MVAKTRYAVVVSSPPEQFVREAEALGIAFEENDLAQLERYLSLLLDANTRFNLTSIRDPDQAWMRHIYDSLTLVPLIVSAHAKRVIDVGSGGGLPGIPLAIIMPDVQFTLLEATGKKAKFLQETSAQLGLANVEVVNDRAETIGQNRAVGGHRELYDVALSRAVGKMALLLELTTPLIKVGGYVLAIKGEQASDEIAAAKGALHRLHCLVVDTHRMLTGTVVVVEKQRSTPKIYPRRAGEPKRSPLL